MNSSAPSASSKVHLIAQRAEQRFALPVASVREVIVMPELEPVPLAPSDVLGSFQLRGEIVPAILPDRLIAIENASSAPSVLVLLRQGDAIVAVAFDRLLGVATIDASELMAHPLAQRRLWMSNIHLDPRYQLVTALDGNRLIAALIEQLQFTHAAG